MKHHPSGFNKQIMVGVILVVVAIGLIIFADQSTTGDVKRIAERDTTMDKRMTSAEDVLNDFYKEYDDDGASVNAAPASVGQTIQFQAETTNCWTPLDGDATTTSQVLCMPEGGIHYLPHGIDVLAVNNASVTIDCAGATIRGNYEGSDVVEQGEAAFNLTTDKPGKGSITIQNCTIEGFDVGVRAEQQMNVGITHNSFANNRFGVRVFFDQIPEDFLVLAITDNHFSHTGKTAIVLRRTSNALISGNTVEDSSLFGFKIRDSHVFQVTNNIIEAKWGITVRNSENGEISQNDITPYTKGRGAGVLVLDTDTGFIFNNSIYGFAFNVLLGPKSQKWIVYANDLYLNGGNENLAADLTKGKNWWYNEEMNKGNYYEGFAAQDATYVISPWSTDPYPLPVPEN